MQQNSYKRNIGLKSLLNVARIVRGCSSFNSKLKQFQSIFNIELNLLEIIWFQANSDHWILDTPTSLGINGTPWPLSPDSSELGLFLVAAHGTRNNNPWHARPKPSYGPRLSIYFLHNKLQTNCFYTRIIIKF